MSKLNEELRRDTPRAGLSKNERKKIATSTKDAHIMSVLSRCKFISKSEKSLSQCKEGYERQLRNCLEQFDVDLETSLVLQALEFSDHVNIYFDMDSKNLVGLAKSDALGWYNKLEGEILIGAKGLITEELMKDELKGVFIHELTHWCMQTVFKNGGLPYSKSVQTQDNTTFHDIVLAVKQDAENLDGVLQSVFGKGYSETQWHRELIVRVPHLIGQHGLKEAIRILSAHKSTIALLNFYKDDVMKKLQGFIKDGNSEISRKNIVELNNKLGLIPLFGKFDLRFETNELIKQEEKCDPKTTLIYGSPHPYLCLMQFIFAQNGREPTEKFYGNNLFCDLYALKENIRAVESTFLKLEECKTLYVVCTDDPSMGNDHRSLIVSLKELLKNNTDKKVILIVDITKLELTGKFLGEELHNISYKCIPLEKIMQLNDLVEEDRKRVMSVGVLVRKQKLELNKILGRKEVGLADGIFIERLIKGEVIIIHEGGITSNYLPPSFIEFKEKLDVTKLVELMDECSNNDIEDNSSTFALIILIVGELSNYPVLKAREERYIYINAVAELEAMLGSTANDVQEANSKKGSGPTRPILVMKYPDESGVKPADVVATFQQLISFDVCYIVNVAPPLSIHVSYMYYPALVFKRRLIGKDTRVFDCMEFLGHTMNYITEWKPMKRLIRELHLDEGRYKDRWYLMELMRELGFQDDEWRDIRHLKKRQGTILESEEHGSLHSWLWMKHVEKLLQRACSELRAGLVSRKCPTRELDWVTDYCPESRTLQTEEWWEIIKNQMKFRYCIIISDTAGRGKTQFLNHIYNTFTDSWIIRYSLKHVDSLIDDYTLEEGSMSVEALLPFVLDIGEITTNEKKLQTITKNDKFTRELIYSKMKNMSPFPVILLLDGFDEITCSKQIKSAATNKTKFLDIIEFLRSKTFLNIIVTTRPECEPEILRKIRETKVYKFEDLTLQESKAYLNNFVYSKFRGMSKSKTERESVRERVGKYILSPLKNQKSADDFLKNPLHVSMMSEILLEDMKDGNTIDSREELYNRFIDRKYNIYLREKKGILCDVEQLFADLKSKWNSVFEMLAVFSLYPHDIEHFYDKKSYDALFVSPWTRKLNPEINGVKYLDYGIILSVSARRIEFIHETFAEHFFSRFLKKFIQDEPNAERFITSILFNKSLQKNHIKLYSHLESAVGCTTIPDGTMKAHRNVIINVDSITYEDGMGYHILNKHMNIIRYIFLCRKPADKVQGTDQIKVNEKIRVNLRSHIDILLLASWDCRCDCMLEFLLEECINLCANDISVMPDEWRRLLPSEKCTLKLLKFAITRGNEKIMEFLKRFGRFDEANDIIVEATLISAIERGELEVAKWVNESNGKNVGDIRCRGRTLVHVALSEKQYDVVRWLVVEEGLDVNEGDHEKRTPLHHAIMCGDLDMVKFICRLGADVHKRSDEGYNAIHYAIKYRVEWDLIKWLVDNTALAESSSSDHCSDGKLKIIKNVIAKYCNEPNTFESTDFWQHEELRQLFQK